MTRPAVVLLFLSILLPAPAIWCTEAKDPSIVSQGEKLLNNPEGNSVAEIRRESRTRLLQREGDWVRVQLDGYIWRPSVEPVVQEITPTEALPSVPVQLKDYGVTWVPQDLKREHPTKRAHVRARFAFQNNMPAEIACLHYQVQFFNLRGQTLHQESMTCESGDTRSSEIAYVQEILWKEYNGKRGDVYRRLERAARQRTIRIDLALKNAYFVDGSQARFED